MPREGREIHVEGTDHSFSAPVLLRVPVAIWNLIPENAAYSFGASLRLVTPWPITKTQRPKTVWTIYFSLITNKTDILLPKLLETTAFSVIRFNPTPNPRIPMEVSRRLHAIPYSCFRTQQMRNSFKMNSRGH